MRSQDYGALAKNKTTDFRNMMFHMLFLLIFYLIQKYLRCFRTFIHTNKMYTI